MDKPTKSLILGTGVGLFIVAGAYAVAVYETSHITRLVEQCKSKPVVHGYEPRSEVEKLHDGEKATSRAWEPPEVKADRCDPAALARLGTDGLLGVQKEIAVAQSNLGVKVNSALWAAGAIFALFSLPFVWYFLLRRIRELSNAIAGK